MALSFIRFGSYDFLAGSSQFQIDKFPMYGRTGRIERYRHRWIQTGWLMGESQDDLSDKIDALEAAILPGQTDLSFMLDSSTASSHVLTSSVCINGITTKLRWLGTSPRGSGIEYAAGKNRRSYQITYEGDIDPEDQDTDIEFWTESIQRFGDGTSQNSWVESLTGMAVPQQTQLFTRCVTIQQGAAIGRTLLPDANLPLWGAPYYQPRPANIGDTTPALIGMNFQRNRRRNWRYEFHSDAPLVGDPTEFTP